MLRDEELIIDVDTDPVCAAEVDGTLAREHGLTIAYEGREYVFCAAPCMTTFLREPKHYAIAGRAMP